MTTERFDDDLDALLKRTDPALGLDPRCVARVSRAVLTRIAAESRIEPRWPLLRLLGRWNGSPRYAGSLALGLALGLAAGLAAGQSVADQPATSAARLYAQVQPLTPLGL